VVCRREFIGRLAGTSVALGMTGCFTSRGDGSVYPGWRPGELDIHLIHTGVGEQSFFMFPDGTTMLIDCGHVNRKPEYVAEIPAMPDGSRTGGEWVRRYLERLTDRREIDYLMITHWHDDHTMGIPDVVRSFSFRRFLDHQHPNRRRFWRDAEEQGYRAVMDWLEKPKAAGTEEMSFSVGARNQIALLHDVEGRYDDSFEIRNIAANGVVWDGGTGSRDCAAEHVRATGNPRVPENMLSSAIRIRYGAFTYFTGGDVEREFKAADGTTYSYEGLVGSVVGSVDVCKMNHHGYWNAMKEPFVRAVRPRVYLSSTWSPQQVNDRNLPIMTSRDLYPGDRDVYPGWLPSSCRQAYAGRSFMDDLAPFQGHTVVKVAPGGASYSVFVLDASDEKMRILCRKDYACVNQRILQKGK